LVAAFVLIGDGWMTKGLEATQQQAVDQLQIVQDQLVAQQTETKKLSDQIATLTQELDALQQSVASIPAAAVAAPVPLPKAQPSKRWCLAWRQVL
jgi:cell division septum initiation protein DivIVA